MGSKVRWRFEQGCSMVPFPRPFTYPLWGFGAAGSRHLYEEGRGTGGRLSLLSFFTSGSVFGARVFGCRLTPLAGLGREDCSCSDRRAQVLIKDHVALLAL